MTRWFVVFGLVGGSVFAQSPARALPELAGLESELRDLAWELRAKTLSDPFMDLSMLAQMKPPKPAIAPVPPDPPALLGGKIIEWSGSEESLYRRGQQATDRRQWDKAIEAFSAAAAKKGAKADGALYWKAYALRKAGQESQALDAIKQLEQDHPKSRWLNDAKALEIEIRQASGKPVSPEAESDEDLKLMAIHSLMQSDSPRAVPLLEKVLFGKSSPRLKEHALFVLSQTQEPRSREILLQVAKGKGNPDLQLKALQFLGMANASSDLAAIYASESDYSVKKTIIDMLGMQKDVKPLLDIARNEKNAELKKQAVRRLVATNRKEANDLLIEILEK